MTNPNERIVFRDYPVGVWFTGMIALAVAVISFITNEVWQAFGVALIGFVIVAFGSVLTVTVDEPRRPETSRAQSETNPVRASNQH